MNTRNLMLITSALVRVLPYANDTGTAGWKKKADGSLELDASGNPIWMNTAGEAISVDGGTITRLNGEAKSHREKAEQAVAKLAAFEGIDPAKAREAFDKLSKIDQKKLIDSGEIDKVRGEIEKGFTGQLEELKKTNAAQADRINNMTLDAAFNGSEFVTKKIVVPADMFRNTFGKHFKIEEGKLVPYDASGSKIYSSKKMGEIADFDEALEKIVDAYPAKDTILKGVNASGSGNNGNGGNRQTGRTMHRREFDALPMNDQVSFAKAVREGTAQLVE